MQQHLVPGTWNCSHRPQIPLGLMIWRLTHCLDNSEKGNFEFLDIFFFIALVLMGGPYFEFLPFFFSYPPTHSVEWKVRIMFLTFNRRVGYVEWFDRYINLFSITLYQYERRIYPEYCVRYLLPLLSRISETGRMK